MWRTVGRRTEHGERSTRLDFTGPFIPRVRSGEITVTVRRWRSLHVRVGGRYDRPRLGGTLVIDAIAPVEPGAVDDGLARAVGFSSARELLAFLDGLAGSAVPTYAIRFHIEPRTADRPPPPQLDVIRPKLARMDGDHPWTNAVLRLIRDNPGRRAGDLAAIRGEETQRFKASVRRLKALGLTESLETGYRLTPLGAEVVASAQS